MNSGIIKTYEGNTMYLQNLMKGFTDADMMLNTGESNTIGWIFGHIILYRGKVLERLHNQFHLLDKEQQFSRGAVKNKNIEMSFEESMAEFIDRGNQLETRLTEVTDEELKKAVEIKDLSIFYRDTLA